MAMRLTVDPSGATRPTYRAIQWALALILFGFFGTGLAADSAGRSSAPPERPQTRSTQAAAGSPRDYRFDGTISREVL